MDTAGHFEVKAGPVVPANLLTRRFGTVVAYLLLFMTAGGLAVSDVAAQDNSAPAVSEVSLFSSPPGGTYQRGDTIEVRVDFDLRVTVTGTPQVSVSIGSQTRTASLSSFAGTRASAVSLFFTYTVQSTDSDTDGIGIPANAIGLGGGSIKAAGDDTVDAVLTHSAVTAGTSHKVDGSRFDTPSVSSVSFHGTPASGDTYQLGEEIEVKVVFDRFIKTSGSPKVAITIGSATRLADWAYSRGFGGGATDMYFDYEVQAEDRDGDGISIAANAIRLDGGSIKAAADGTTDASLTHSAVADDASRKVAGSQVSAPSVSSVYFVGSPKNGNSYQPGETISVQANLDRTVDVTGSPQVALTIGSRTRYATYPSNVTRLGIQVLAFRYEVQALDRDTDGISIAANSIRLNGGTITATDGTTDADLSHAAVAADPRHRVGAGQATGPVVSFVWFASSPASGEYFRQGESIDVTVRFSEAVTVTGSPRVAVSVGSNTRNATYSSSDRSGTELTFGYAVQGSDLDLDGVSIAANALGLNGGTIRKTDTTTDAVLTHTAVSASSSRKVDGKTTAPAVSSISFSGSPAGGDTYARGEKIEVRVEFDRPVTVTGTPQVGLAIGSHTRAAAFSSIRLGVTANFAYTVRESDRDADGIAIAANALGLAGGSIKAAADGTTDAVLNHAAVAADATRKVDGSLAVAPAVTGVSFAGSAPAGNTYRPGQAIQVEVRFSRPVTVTGSPVVDLTVGSATRAAAFFSVSSSGTTATFDYRVQDGDEDTDGVSIAANAIRLAGGTIKGADGVTDAVLTHAAVAADPSRKVGASVQGTAPVVSRLFFSSYPASGDTFQFGEAIRVEVVFDRPVTVTGNPQVGLTIGTATRSAVFSSDSRSGISSLAFEYLVQAADRDADGIGIAANALVLGGGTIQAADSAVDAVLAHAAVAADANRKVDGSRASAPAVSSVSFTSTPADGATYELGETIRVTVEFDRPVTATGSPQVGLTIGTATRQAAYRTSYSRSLYFDYPVQAADLDNDGIAIAANGLSLNGGTIKSAAEDATDADLSHASVSVAHRVDGGTVTAPAARHVSFSGSPASGDTYGRGETITVEVVFSRTVMVTGSPQVALTVGSRTRAASYVSGTQRLAFEYTVQADDRDSDGVSIAADALSLAGGSITALDGTTAATLQHQPVAASRNRKVDGSRVRPPAVSGVAFSGSPASGDTYELGETIAVTVTFDKPVTVIGSPEVALTVGSRTRQAAFSTPAATGVTTLAFHYPVQASDRDADGIAIPANAIRLNGGTITDADDDAVDARLGHAAVPADAARKVDGGQVSAPAVTAVSFSGSPASGDTYELGETVRVRVAFDKPVTVTGSPRIGLTIGSHTRPAAFASASSGRVLTFAYTVQTQDADADGISIAADAIRLAGGTITAAVDTGTAADLAHAAVATDPGRKVDGSRVTAPAVSAIAFAGRPAGAGTYVRGETIRVQVRFNRAVTVSGSPQVALLLGSATRTAAFAPSDSTATVLHFAYAVQAADLDSDGISIAADAIRLAGGSVKAADGVTDADLGHAAVAADATRKVDGRITGPVVSGITFITTPLAAATFQRGENIDVQVEFNQPITFSGNPLVELNIGSRTRPATWAYVPGPTALAFSYTVQAGDLDADGVSIAANAIRLGGGSIKAADGVTDAILAHAPVAADPSRKVNGNQVTAPSVSRISFVGSPADGTTYQLGETIEVKVEFDRYVSGSGSLRLALTIGGQTRLARYSHGRGFGGVTDLHFRYVVQETDFDADGVSIGADAIRLGGGSITTADRATAADLSHAALPDDATRRVDGIQVTGPALTRIYFVGVPDSGDSYQRGETISVHVIFDRLVTVSGSPQVELTIGSRTARATLSSYGLGVRVLGFEYEVQALDADADGVSIAADAIRLGGGSITATDGTTAARLTHPAVADDLTRKVGRVRDAATATAVSSVFFSSSPAGGDTYERGETIEVRVVFNRSVRVAGTPQVELSVGGQTRAALFWGTHFGRTLSFNYEVQASDVDRDGIAIAADAIRLGGGSIKAADGVTDAVLTHAALAGDPGRKVDGRLVTAPKVSAVSIASRPRAGTTYGRGETIVVEVAFSEPVAVTGAPELALTLGSVARSAAFVRSGERSLWFRYRVAGDDRDADGIGIAAGALTLNGGSITDRTGHAAQLDLGVHAIAAAAGHRVDGALVDSAAPAVAAVTLISAPQSGSTFVFGETIEIEVRFSEQVTVTGAPRLTLSIGSGRRSAGYASSREQVVRFRYVVQDGDSGALGAATGALALNGGTILDAAGNAAVLSLGSANLDFGVAVNGVEPDDDPPAASSVLFESLPPGGAYARGDSVQVAVRFNEPVTVTGMPRLALAVGTTERHAPFFSSGQEYVRFRYTVQEQDRDADGIGVAAGGLSLNGGTIADAAGNPADLSLGAAAIGSGHAVNGGAKTQTMPTRAAVTSAPRSGGTYGRGESVDVEVQFNKDVTVAGQPQLELTIGSNPPGASRSGRGTASQTGTAPKRLANFVSGANERLQFRYVVRAADDSLGGGITIAADALRLNGASITDAAGEPVAAHNLRLDGAEVVHGDPVDGGVNEPATAERVAVTSAPQDDRTYRLGEAIVVEVRFSTEVAVSGAPQLELAIDGTGSATTATRRASFVAADRDTLRFRYPVQAGDDDSDGIGIPANALHLNGGTIVDLVGEPAELGLEQAQLVIPAHRVDGQTADATPPVVESVAIVSRPPAGRYLYGDTVSVEVTFSEPVEVAGSPQLALHVGSADRLADFSDQARPMPDTVQFVYTVRAGDRDADGIAIPADALRPNGGAIRDGNGNDANLGSSAVPPSAAHSVSPGVRIGCKQPVAAARTMSQAAAGGSGSGLDNHDFDVALELDENRDGSEHPIHLGCVALAAPDRHFSYAITAGNDDSRFAVGALDGLLTYVGRGEDAEHTREYPLTITAQDGRKALALMVRVAIVDVDDRGLVTLSTTQPRTGEELSARLDDQDDHVRDLRWQWWRRTAPDGEWTAIMDATASSFTPAAADAGSYLQARVTYADEHGSQGAESERTEAVEGGPNRRDRILQLGLAGFGRAVATTAVNVIGQRFAPPPTAPESQGARVDVALNGRSLRLADMADTQARASLARRLVEAFGIHVTPDRTVSFQPPPGEAFLANSSFSVGRGRGAGRWGFWGAGDMSRFEGDLDEIDQEGDVIAGYLGADFRVSPSALLGLAASYSTLDLTSATEEDGDATLTSHLVNVYPYGSWAPVEGLGLWGLAGLGTGGARLTDAGGSRDGDLRMWLGATGQRVELLSGSVLSVAAKSDGFITGVTSGGGLPSLHANAWRVRVLLEGGVEWRTGDSVLSGSAELGGRLDGGDAEHGLGVETGAEISFRHTGIGLGLSGRGRMLLAHEDSRLRDWGVSAMLDWRPPGLGSGPAVSITPAWGSPAGGATRLWNDRTVVLADHGGGPPTRDGSGWLPDSAAVKLSYALEVREVGRLEPYAEVGIEDEDARLIRIGVAVDVPKTPWMQLEAFGQRTAETGSSSSYRVGLEGTLGY